MNLSQDIPKVPTRLGFAQGLLEAATIYPEIVGIGSDITISVGIDLFAKAFPERFISLGIAEQNAITVAAGMALCGKIPVVASYATFIAMRTLDQIRVSVCYNNLNVKIGGAHAGISVGPDGATHQALEDIGALRSLPNITILSPADANQTKKAVLEAIKHHGPVYIRYGREAMPNFYPEHHHFTIGKSHILTEGKHVVIYATGHLVWEALQAHEMLKKQKGITSTVVDLYSIKPIDTKTIVETAKQAQIAITAEEHQINGGLFSAVSEEIVQNYPIKIIPVGMNNCFGESGHPLELMHKYKMDRFAIYNAVIQNLP